MWLLHCDLLAIFFMSKTKRSRFCISFGKTFNCGASKKTIVSKAKIMDMERKTFDPITDSLLFSSPLLLSNSYVEEVGGFLDPAEIASNFSFLSAS